MNLTKISKFKILLPAIIAFSIAVGIFIGVELLNGDQLKSKSVKVSGSRYRKVMHQIDVNYVDSVNTDKLTDAAIKAVLDQLDPHSVYIPPKKAKYVNSELEGNFEGVGIEFQIIKDTLYVIAPVSGGPSEAVGINAGDKIVEVNGKDITGKDLTNQKVFDLLRGKKGSEVTVGIKRNGAENILHFTITRDKIPTHSVQSYFMINDKAGYIKINRFASTTYNEFKDALHTLIDKGMEQLMLDLRGNPGGYMDQATKMADEFLGDNKMIVYTKAKNPLNESEIRASGGDAFEEGALVVLLDEGSASASEIVAGALQDNDRAILAGRRSYGKGLVQMPVRLSDSSQIRLTISRYYTPSGRCIQKPYKNKENYEHELTDRYKHGEFFHADSIEFNDSLKHHTSQGRVVYGGGGIMPDYFVAKDTSYESTFLNKLFHKGVFREYTLTYFNEHKNKLEKMGFEQYKYNFNVSNVMINAFKATAKSSNIAINIDAFHKSNTFIKNRIKALIARHAWGDKAYYKIDLQHDNIYQKGIHLFDEAAEIIRQKKL